MGTATNDFVTESHDTTEIRLLGPLRVRRADGTLVDHQVWRTRKTVDLLRLLALHSSRPVPVSRLIELLWPDVPGERGRASLRTAASTVRQVLGAGHVERRYGGLVLQGAWVDAVAFQSLSRQVAAYVREDMPARAVVAAWQAQALYLDDLEADPRSGSWAEQERASLRETLAGVLQDGADAAAELGWHRDAVALARHAVDLDRCAERPVRTLIRAYSSLGEQEHALRSFQRLRRALVDELGADPSPQTDRLHVAALTGRVASAPLPRAPFTGRSAQLRAVVEVIGEAVAQAQPTVVELSGDDGCGRRRLLDEAVARVASDRDHAAGSLDRSPVVVDLVPTSALPGRLPGDHEGADVPPGEEPLVLATPEVGDRLRAHLQERGWAVRRVALPALDREEVGSLASAVLGGPLGESLLDHVVEETAGAPASVVALARSLLRTGRVRSTAEGMVLVPGDDGPGADAQALLSAALHLLDAADEETLLALALLQPPVDLEALRPALRASGGARSLQQTADQLVDLGLLTSGPAGYAFRHPLIAASVRSWARPSARRAAHARLAERAVLPSAERVHHWLQAGEPQLACAASLDAAWATLALGRYEDARQSLLQARSLSTMLGTDPADQVEVAERLADVCVALGRFEEAVDEYAFVLREARELPPGHLAEVRRRHAAAAEGRAVSGTGAVDRRAGARPWTLDELGDKLGVPADAAPSTRVEELLSSALREASASASPEGSDRAAAIRILLADRVLVPRRQLARSRRVLQAVPALTSRPDLLDRAAVARWLPEVVLGGARAAAGPLAAAVVAARDPRAGARLRLLSLLCRHDVGVPERASPDDDLALLAGDGWHWVGLRTLAESAPPAPGAPAGGPWIASPAPRSSLASQLECLAQGEAHEAAGARDAAAAVLRVAADDAVTTGSVLLLPEIAARLVMIDCALDVDRAADDFDLMDWALGGESAHPRETYFRLLARTFVRAHHREPDRARVSATAARAVAEEHGLVRLRARADDVLEVLRQMERRRRSTDGRDELDEPAPAGVPERRTRFPRLAPAAAPTTTAPSPQPP